jgi:multidrug efflux pump subunit AcrA (membrane-fusion protein)
MRFIGRSLFGLFLIALTFGLLATSVGLVYSSFQERNAKQSSKRPQKERVFSAHVIKGMASAIQPEIEAFGEIQSKRTLDIRIPVGGTIVYLSPNFVEGGKVTKDEVLVITDATDSEDKVTLAKADLNDANDDLIEATNALELANDDLNAAIKQSDLRNQALARKKGLIDKGVVSEASLESAELSAASAEQSVLSKRKAILQAQSRLSQSKGTVIRRELAFANAERKLKNTQVKAEFDGTLSNVSLVSGGIVNNNERVGLLVDPSSLEVKFRISATQFNRLIDDSGNLQTIPTFVKLDVFGTEISASGFIERSSATVGTGLTGRLLISNLSQGNVSSFRSGDFVTVSLKEPILEQCY